MNRKNYSIEYQISPPPPAIIAEAVRIVKSGNSTYRYSKHENRKYGNFDTYNVGGDLKKWIDDNIGILFDQPYFAIVQSISSNLHSHVDTNRTFVYNFLIDTGGDDVHTYWADGLDDDSNVIDDIVLPVGVWHRLDVSTPHGVKNITGNRIAISVGNVTKINREAVRQQREKLKELLKTKNES